MKVGIEFELITYTNDEELRDNFLDSCQALGWEVDDDGSVSASDSVSNNYDSTDEYEIKTKPYSNINDLIKDITKIFRQKHIAINGDKPNRKGLRIDFNNTTGMHIHFSNGTISTINTEYSDLDDLNEDLETKIVTPELVLLRNTDTLKAMYKYIEEHIKYASIKKDFIRSCIHRIDDLDERYSAINVSDENEHGTIEFRLFNLHGIHTNSFVPAITHMLKLMSESLLVGYKLAEKNKPQITQDLDDRIISLKRQLKEAQLIKRNATIKKIASCKGKLLKQFKQYKLIKGDVKWSV